MSSASATVSGNFVFVVSGKKHTIIPENSAEPPNTNNGSVGQIRA